MQPVLKWLQLQSSAKHITEVSTHKHRINEEHMNTTKQAYMLFSDYFKYSDVRYVRTEKKTNSTFAILIEMWQWINVQPGNLHVNEPKVTYKTKQIIISPWEQNFFLKRFQKIFLTTWIDFHSFQFPIGRNHRNRWICWIWNKCPVRVELELYLHLTFQTMSITNEDCWE